MFENSPNTMTILEFFNKKYGQKVAPVGLLKVLSIASAKLYNNLPKFNVLHVAPSRQFKSATTRDATTFFPKTMYIDLGTDVTMHGIAERFRKGREANLGKKCLLINDATILFKTKKVASKERLIGGLTALLSDGEWIYSERQEPLLTLRGEVSSIMNMTLESYQRNKETLFSSTFHERFLTVFYTLPEPEINEWLENEEEKKQILNNIKLKLKPTKQNMEKWKKLLIDYAKRFSILSNKSRIGQFDLIKALVVTHASINNREINQEDFDLLKMVEEYLVDPLAPNEPKIIQYYMQGLSVKDICLKLGKKPESYKAYVSRVLRKAKERGVIW